MRKSFTASFTVLILAGPFTLPASSGWVETHVEGKTVFYSTGKIKEMTADDPKWSVVGIGDQSLLLVHNERRVYAHGSIDDYCRSMETSLQAAIATIPPEERALMEQWVAGGERRTGRHPQITIGRVGGARPVAGLGTDKYVVLVDGKLYEELWLASDAPILMELDAVAIRNLEKKMTACMEHIAEVVTGTWLTQPEQDVSYQGLMAKGWLMRRTSYNDGSLLTEMEVTRLEKRTIPATEFQPPSGFLKVPFEEFIFED